MATVVDDRTEAPPRCAHCREVVAAPHPVQYWRAGQGLPVYCDRWCRSRARYRRATREQREQRMAVVREYYLRAFRLGTSGSNGVTPETSDGFMEDFVRAMCGESPSRSPHGTVTAWQRGIEVGRAVRYCKGLSK